MRRTILSENQYAPKFIAAAKTNAITMPWLHPMNRPMARMIPVSKPSSSVVFKAFDIRGVLRPCRLDDARSILFDRFAVLLRVPAKLSESLLPCQGRSAAACYEFACAGHPIGSGFPDCTHSPSAGDYSACQPRPLTVGGTGPLARNRGVFG